MFQRHGVRSVPVLIETSAIVVEVRERTVSGTSSSDLPRNGRRVATESVMRNSAAGESAYNCREVDTSGMVST